MRPLNYIILMCSILAQLSDQMANYLVFTPSNFISMGEQKESNSSTIYVWTILTSIFTETSLSALALNLFLINFVIYKNKENIEFAWGGYKSTEDQ